MLAEDKQQTLKLDSRQHAMVEGDRDLLFQAISNLLDNAIKYTPPGGDIKLGLESIPARPGWIELSVCDNGPGVPDEEYSQISRRFYRVDSSRTEPGNGLGLSLAEAVAALHQGELAFKGNQPSGLCACLSLPFLGRE